VKVLFFGSSEFSVPFLEELINTGHDIIIVFTGFDKERGRGKIISPNPVKSFASGKKLYVSEIEDFTDSFYEKMVHSGFDYIISVSFGRIFPEKFIELAGGKTINVHPSILPAYRGPSPIISALLNGEALTGITLIKIEKKIDSGDIYMQTHLAIAAKDNRETLEEKLSLVGKKMLVLLLELLKNENTAAYPQPENGISYTGFFTAKDTVIDWKKSQAHIINHIRAFGFSPGSKTNYRGKIIKVLSAKPVKDPYNGTKNNFQNGQVVRADRQGLIVKCGEPGKNDSSSISNFISLQKLKPQDKNSMDYVDFLNGYRVKPGDFFE